VLRRRLPKPSDEDERRVVANIREHGWHAMHVRDEFHPEHAGLPQPDQDPAVVAAGADGFSYTVGLWTEHHHPELVITGDWGPWERMHEILAAAVTRILDDGAHFDAGDEDDLVLVTHPVRFGAVAERYRNEMLTWAHWAARRRRFDALQLVICDRDRRWPGDPAYAGPRQPLLAA
jgi:hypothetical protein